MADEDTTYTIRLPKDLKNAFELAVKAEDMTGAQMVRKWMRGYVEYYMKHNAQQDMLEGSKKGRK